MARTADEDLTVELLSLSSDPTGDIHGILRIHNHAKTPLEEQGCWIVNHLLIASSGNQVSLNIPAEATAYYAFTYQNRCFLQKPFSVGGRQIEYTLNADSLLERQGEQKIESLQLIFGNASRLRTMTLNLDAPIPLRPAQTDSIETKPLLEGQIRAEVERIFTADDGIGLRIVCSNPTDRDISIIEGGWKVNGLSLPMEETADALTVPAHGTAIHCAGVRVPEPFFGGEAPEKIELVFRVNNEYCTTAAAISFHGAELGHYVPPDSYSVIPAIYSRPEISFDPDQVSIGPYTAQISGNVCNGSAADPLGMFDSEKTYLSFLIQVSNPTENKAYLHFTNLSLNTERAVDSSWGDMEIEPGGVSDAAVYVTDLDLLGMTKLNQISSTVSFSSTNGFVLDFASVRAVDFRLQPLDLTALTAEGPTPLASMTRNALSWQVLDLQTDETNGSMSIELYIKNQSESFTNVPSFEVYVNGWLFGNKDSFVLAPSQDIVLRIDSENSIVLTKDELEISQRSEPVILEERILQHHGIETAEEIRIVPKGSGIINDLC